MSEAPAAAQPQRVIAIFDFDDTLVKGDTLWPFLVYTAGLDRCVAALLESLLICGWRLRKRNPQDPGFRIMLKTELLSRTLKGCKVTSLPKPINRLRRWLNWIEPIRTELLRHHSEGHHIVIASGALDIYLKDLIVDLPHHSLIATRMEIVDGRLTGQMIGGNCVRDGKAARIKEYLLQCGPFDDSWAYGNYPHDVPMMELTHHRIIV